MLITCLSDTHGLLPANLPKADVLVIAGDICPGCDHNVIFQQLWIQGNFMPWLKDLQKNGVFKYALFIAGNHDFFFEEYDAKKWELSNDDHPMKGYSGIYYLQDNSVTIEGVKFWGSPWQREFGGWAFNLKEYQLAFKYGGIPKDVDVLVTHGPPMFYGDHKLIPGIHPEFPQKVYLGSPSLTETIKYVNPKLVVTGHIHSGYGQYDFYDTKIVNASYVQEAKHEYESYRWNGQPIIQVEV